MLLHADVNQCIKAPYQMVSINYFPTSIKRLYQIGSTTGEWLEYKDEAIKVNQGKTIYAKGIDKYGNDTRIISSHIVNVTDALGANAYDGKDNTYERNYNGHKKIMVDSSLWGKKIRLKVITKSRASTTTNCWSYIIQYNDKGKELLNTLYRASTNIDTLYTIKSGTKYISFYTGDDAGSYIDVYDIKFSE